MTTETEQQDQLLAEAAWCLQAAREKVGQAQARAVQLPPHNLDPVRVLLAYLAQVVEEMKRSLPPEAGELIAS